MPELLVAWIVSAYAGRKRWPYWTCAAIAIGFDVLWMARVYATSLNPEMQAQTLQAGFIVVAPVVFLIARFIPAAPSRPADGS